MSRAEQQREPKVHPAANDKGCDGRAPQQGRNNNGKEVGHRLDWHNPMSDEGAVVVGPRQARRTGCYNGAVLEVRWKRGLW